jgi:L-glutamine-phosphate cytidylyltransferase
MRAIILAAGQGSRLRPLTDDRPKCLVELGGRTLLDYQVAALRAAGAHEVVVVTGYRADAIERLGLPTRHNPLYARTNMVVSLMSAADVLRSGDDVLISYGDIVYLPRIAQALAASDAAFATTVDRRWLDLWGLRNEDPLADAETLRMDASGAILELGGRPSSLAEIEAQYMGLIRLDAAMASEVVDVWGALDPATQRDGRGLDQMYMTSLLQALIDDGKRLQAVPVDGGWLEVDTVEDLALYQRLDATDALHATIGLRLADCA